MRLLCFHPQCPVQNYDYWDKKLFESENGLNIVLSLFNLTARSLHSKLLFVCTSDSSRIIMVQG